MISIRNPEVERIAKRIAQERSVSMTDAILLALRGLGNASGLLAEEKARRLKRIALRLRSFPDMDTRRDDEILGYDENGGFPHGR